MISERGFALFDTPVGTCGIAWNERGIAGVQLPETSEQKTRARLTARFPQSSEERTPPPEVQRAIDGIAATIRGEACDLSSVRLDMRDVPGFNRRVYEVARTIAPGTTMTYGEIAARLGAPREAARDVGQALGNNPFAVIVPCHRVLAAGGKPGGFSAHGGVTTKLRLLALEGVDAFGAPTLFDSEELLRLR